MIEKLVSFAYYGTYQTGAFGDFLDSLAANGFFSLFLPFLLIFALILGILNQTNMFKENKAINPIIAFVVALMSLQFGFVTDFFSQIFPRMAVGLSVILVLLILVGIFIPKKNWVTYALLGISAVILIIVLVQSAGAVGWTAGEWWYNNWPTVAGAVFILIIIAVIVGASNPSDKTPVESIVTRLLGKE